MLNNHYAVLGVPMDASPSAIKQAYRVKAMASHPDRGGSHEAMLAINEAYEILINPETRRHYDAACANQNNQSAQQQAQADATQARQQASQYPRSWTDFETWLAKDFTQAEYGQWGWVPTASKSSSGILFILIGLVVGAIAAGILAEGEILVGKSLIMIVFAGGFIGQWLHKQIGKSMQPPGSPPSNSTNAQSIIVSCPQCTQKLRAPASGVRLRCPACQFQFNTTG